MTAEETIVASVRSVVGDRPVVLAGSRAVGRAHAASDWDLVVVVPLLRAPFLVRPLERLSSRLSAELGAPVDVKPLPAAFLRDARRLFVWKLRREGRVLWAPDGFVLPAAPPPELGARARFSLALSGLLYLDAGRAEHARRALADLRQLAAGTYGEEPGDAEPRDENELRAALASFAQPFPPSGPLRTLVRNAQYALLSRLHGRSRWSALWWTEPADRRLARRALAGEDVRDEWEAAHPLLGF